MIDDRVKLGIKFDVQRLRSDLGQLQSIEWIDQCPLMAVRIMKLTPGSRIREHTDHDLDIDRGLARLHVPIITIEYVYFRLNGTRIVMNEGECWYLRLSDRHSVENNGQSDRIHLVIDAEANS